MELIIQSPAHPQTHPRSHIILLLGSLSKKGPEWRRRVCIVGSPEFHCHSHSRWRDRKSRTAGRMLAGVSIAVIMENSNSVLNNLALGLKWNAVNYSTWETWEGDYARPEILPAALQIKVALASQYSREKGESGEAGSLRDSFQLLSCGTSTGNTMFTAHSLQLTSPRLCSQVISLVMWVPPRWLCPGKCPVFVKGPFLYLFPVSLVVRFRTPHIICILLHETCLFL